MKVCVKRDSLFFKPPLGATLIALAARHDPIDTHDRWNTPMQALNADIQDRVLALIKAILEQNAITAK